MQLAKSVKTGKNKVTVSSILQRKDKFNSKMKEVSINLQDIHSKNRPTAALTNTITLM